MTHEEILKKAIEKAEKNGLNMDIPYSMFSFEYQNWNWHNTIFSHQFAKAFWGSGTAYKTSRIKKHYMTYPKGVVATRSYTTKKNLKKVAWKYHLQQMVLGDDPIIYLEQFI